MELRFLQIKILNACAVAYASLLDRQTLREALLHVQILEEVEHAPFAVLVRHARVHEPLLHALLFDPGRDQRRAESVLRDGPLQPVGALLSRVNERVGQLCVSSPVKQNER